MRRIVIRALSASSALALGAGLIVGLGSTSALAAPVAAHAASTVAVSHTHHAQAAPADWWF